MNVNPLVIGSVDKSDVLYGGLEYELRSTDGAVLARAREDLGDSTGKRLVRSFMRTMTSTRSLVVESPDGETLHLQEERTRRESRTSVSTAAGVLIGTVTLTERFGASRRFAVHDAYGRDMASFGISGPKNMWEGCPVTGPDGRPLADIAITGRRNKTLTYFPDFTVHQRVALPDPLPLLLRVAAMPLDYAEIEDP
ncbi:hypothetical protein [Nocardiopsis suaedae]|uniref:Scramblase n=1 Tax=Nocardiopsis suaedae TaxID=3018444 RepID=A0ABT4TE43_9ACTN|nr:hypothetical protein [Nocardiopsis suaedae]MDA2802937.1 hypothetical protein [Nocardiopsis suaedae]